MLNVDMLNVDVLNVVLSAWGDILYQYHYRYNYEYCGYDDSIIDLYM